MFFFLPYLNGTFISLILLLSGLSEFLLLNTELKKSIQYNVATTHKHVVIPIVSTPILLQLSVSVLETCKDFKSLNKIDLLSKKICFTRTDLANYFYHENKELKGTLRQWERIKHFERV